MNKIITIINLIFIILLLSCGNKSVKQAPIKLNAEIILQTGHLGNVNSLTFSTDKQYILSASDDRTIKIWSLETNKEVKSLKIQTGQQTEITSLAYSNDGKYIICGDSKGMIHIWNAKNYEFIRTFKAHADQINYISSHADGKKFITGSEDKTIKMWEIPSMRMLYKFDGHFAGVNHASFSNDGNYIISASKDSSIRMWEISRAKQFRSWVVSSNKPSMALSSDNHYIAINNQRFKVMHIWDTWYFRENSKSDTEFTWLSSGNNDDEFFAITKDQIELWEFSTCKQKKVIYTEDGIGEAITEFKLSSDGTLIGIVLKHKEIRIISVADGKLTNSFGKISLDAQNITITPDKKYIVSNSSLSIGGLLASFEIDSIQNSYSVRNLSLEGTPFVFYSNSQLLVEKAYKQVVLFDFANGQNRVNYNDIVTYPLIISPANDNYFIARNNNYLQICNIQTGGKIQNLHKLDSYFKFGAFTPDGKYFLLSTLTYTTVFEMPYGREVKSFATYDFGEIKAIDMDIDENYISIEAHHNQIILRNILSGNVIKKFADIGFHEIQDLKMNKAKNQIAVADLNGNAFLYNIASRKIIKTIFHNSEVYSVCFSPDDKIVISSSIDGQIKFWQTVPGKELITVVGILNTTSEKNYKVDFIAYTPDCRFDGNESAIRKAILLKRGTEYLPLNSYWKILYTPGLIKQVLNY